MTKILKIDAIDYAQKTLIKIKRERRIAMFNQARKYHKWLPSKWAMRLYKFLDIPIAGEWRQYEVLYWGLEADAYGLLKKCCVEHSDFVYLDRDELNLVAKAKKCGDAE